ncbi:MAG TPA: cache domain-containing protein, partial [Anaerolineae bacterium]|nr:cache domain-containing protein [Anaerolineae bacterium]
MRFDKDTDSRRSLSVKGRLFLLLTVMIVPFIAFSIFKAYEIHNHLEEEASINSLSLAKNIAQDIDDYIQSTSELLILLANNTDVRAQNYPAVDAWLKKIKPKYPFYSNIIFVDTDGYIQATARPTDGGPEKVNVRDTTYFKRAMRSSSIAVGDFMHGK